MLPVQNSGGENGSVNQELSNSALRYAVRHLMQVAAPDCSYEISFYPDQLALEINMEDCATITLPYISKSRWPELLQGTFPAVMVKSFDGREDVPLFFPDKHTEFAGWTGANLHIFSDVLTMTFLLLSREEERQIPQRDGYGRFLYEYSLAKKYNFIDIPIVDEWAMLIRKELMLHFPEDKLGSNTPSMRLTHDMDTARRFPDLMTAAKSILGGDLFLRKSPRIAFESLRQYLASRTNPEKDPELLGAEKLLELSLQYGFHSEFYFMGLAQGEPDFRYEVSAPAVKAFAQKAEISGMNCGFHGSKLTPQDAERFSVEQNRVSVALGGLPNRGRQHYLCFDVEKTPGVWESAGIRWDSTLGYADREGFRCGTCHSFPVYDVVNDHPVSVMEQPLIVMDGSMRGRGLCTEEAFASMRHLCERCCVVGGEFVLLWHNRSTGREWKNWFEQVYLLFLKWAKERYQKEGLYDK